MEDMRFCAAKVFIHPKLSPQFVNKSVLSYFFLIFFDIFIQLDLVILMYYLLFF